MSTSSANPELRVAHGDWQDAVAGPTGRGARYPFLIPEGEQDPRPLLHISLAAAATPRRKRVLPALLDSGAGASIAGASLCPALGIDLELGTPCKPSTGIGGRGGRAFAHMVRLSLLEPLATSGDAPIAFGPLTFPLQFMEQNIPFVLLGQNDVLGHFAYRQVARKGYFELRWLP